VRQVCTAATTATRRCFEPSVPRVRSSSWGKRCTDEWRSDAVWRSTSGTSAAPRTFCWRPIVAAPARESARYECQMRSSRARGPASRNSKHTWKLVMSAFKVHFYTHRFCVRLLTVITIIFIRNLFLHHHHHVYLLVCTPILNKINQMTVMMSSLENMWQIHTHKPAMNTVSSRVQSNNTESRTHCVADAIRQCAGVIQL